MTTTIQRLTISGGPYEIGHTLGRAGAAAIRDVIPALAEYRGLRRWRGSDRLRRLEDAARSAYPAYVRELEGLADGAGAAFDDLLIWNCRGDLAEDGDDGEEGCTTVFLPGGGTGAVIGHNEDGQAGMDGHCVLATVEPADGVGFTAFCYPGMTPGNTFGVNAAGLVQTINHLSVGDRKPGIPRQFVARAVLGSRTLDEALDHLGRADRASGFHHGLAQAGDDRVLAVEAPASVCAVRHLTAPAAHANHLVFKDATHLACETSDSSAARQQRAESLLRDGAGISGDPTAVLFDVESDAPPIHRRGDLAPDDGCTLATAVFRVSADGVSWAVHYDGAAQPVYTGEVAP